MDICVVLILVPHWRSQTASPSRNLVWFFCWLHLFAFFFSVGEDGEDKANEYQVDMMRHLRKINVDHNTVGWYQSALNENIIPTQFDFQENIARSVVLLYDPLRSSQVDHTPLHDSTFWHRVHYACKLSDCPLHFSKLCEVRAAGALSRLRQWHAPSWLSRTSLRKSQCI